LGLRPRYNEARLAQYPKVLRHSRLADGESFAQLAGGLLARSQLLDDATPHRVCDSTERFHYRRYITIKL
jgi:hypothetical protein